MEKKNTTSRGIKPALRQSSVRRTAMVVVRVPCSVLGPHVFSVRAVSHILHVVRALSCARRASSLQRVIFPSSPRSRDPDRSLLKKINNTVLLFSRHPSATVFRFDWGLTRATCTCPPRQSLPARPWRATLVPSPNTASAYPMWWSQGPSVLGSWIW